MQIEKGKYITFNKKGRGHTRRQLHGKIISIDEKHFTVDYGNYRESFLLSDIGLDVQIIDMGNNPRPRVVRGDEGV